MQEPPILTGLLMIEMKMVVIAVPEESETASLFCMNKTKKNRTLDLANDEGKIISE